MRKPNLEKLSYVELLELRDNVQGAIERRKAEEQATLREKIQEIAKEAGFELEEVVAKRIAKRTRAKVAPKYRDPKDQAWTGRGRQPRWPVAELKKGKKLEEFLIGLASG